MRQRMGGVLFAVLLAATDGGVDAGAARRPCEYPGFSSCEEDGYLTAEMSARLDAMDALNGFQKAEWGMTLPKVKALFPGAKPYAKGDLIVSGTRVAGLKADLAFNFQDGHLTAVLALFDKEQKETDMRDQICAALHEALEGKYGGPRNTEKKLGGTMAAWAGEKTIIGLNCDQFAIKPMTEVSLTYVSKASLEKKPHVKGDDL